MKKVNKKSEEKLTVVYQDKHCYNALRDKTFNSEKEMLEFLESDDICPEGERVEYYVVSKALKFGEVNKT